MGTLFYGANRLAIEIDDRALAHLQLAIVTKLRRHESFAFTWRHDDAAGQGRNVVWLHESIPLHFSYAGSRMANINRHWIDSLLATATTTLGMRVVDEPLIEGSAQTPTSMSVDGA